MTIRETQPGSATDALLTVTADLAGERDAVVVLRATGEVDLSTVNVLRRHLTEHLTAGHGIVLDVTAVTFLAGCGLGLLAECAEQARDNGVALRLVTDGTRPVLRPLEVTGLASVIPQADSIADGILLCSG